MITQFLLRTIVIPAIATQTREIKKPMIPKKMIQPKEKLPDSDSSVKLPARDCSTAPTIASNQACGVRFIVEK